jgi:hypothetical protein
MDRNDYLKDLKSPQWQKKRLEIMQRDNFTCQHCGCTDKTLNVHHKYYKPKHKPWEYDDADLITLCEDCHDDVTGSKELMYDAFCNAKRFFEQYGFSDSVFYSILMSFCFYFYRILNNNGERHWYIECMIRDSLYGKFNYDDVKTAAKLGIRLDDIVTKYFPNFLDEYKNITLDERFNDNVDDYPF